MLGLGQGFKIWVRTRVSVRVKKIGSAKEKNGTSKETTFDGGPEFIMTSEF